jgi:hypothetical protein
MAFDADLVVTRASEAPDGAPGGAVVPAVSETIWSLCQ